MLIWDHSPTLARFAQFELRYYGLFFLLTFWGGYRLWCWQMLRAGRSKQCAKYFLLLALLGVLVGGRLGHILFYEPVAFLEHPGKIPLFWEGGLASHGSALGLLVALGWFARKESLPFIEVCDRLTFSCAWGAAWVRLGNFFNSEIVGRVTELPWGVKFPRYDRHLPPELVPLRHPSQIYEFVLGMMVLTILYLVDRRAGKENRPRGLLIATFFLLYFSGRFAVEYVKEYQVLDASHSLLTMGQYLSLPFIIAGLAGLVRVLRDNPKVVRTEVSRN